MTRSIGFWRLVLALVVDLRSDTLALTVIRLVHTLVEHLVDTYMFVSIAYLIYLKCLQAFSALDWRVCLHLRRQVLVQISLVEGSAASWRVALLISCKRMVLLKALSESLIDSPSILTLPLF